MDSCIEFQLDALDYFLAKDIRKIKERINSENQEQPKAIHKQIQEKDPESNNDINVILDNYIEQDSNQTVDLDPIQTNLDKVTVLQEVDLETPFMTPDLAHLTPHIAEGIRKIIREHLQAFAKDEADIGEIKLFQVHQQLNQNFGKL